MDGFLPAAPPADFMDRLNNLDPTLHLNWAPELERWQIWGRDINGQLYHIMNVMEPDGAYRPLDGRTIEILLRNRFYAQHVDLAEKVLVDSIYEERQRQETRVHDDLKHLAKDKSLKRDWEKFRDMVGSIPRREWEQPRRLRDMETGKPTEAWYTPHRSWLKR